MDNRVRKTGMAFISCTHYNLKSFSSALFPPSRTRQRISTDEPNKTSLTTPLPSSISSVIPGGTNPANATMLATSEYQDTAFASISMSSSSVAISSEILQAGESSQHIGTEISEYETSTLPMRTISTINEQDTTIQDNLIEDISDITEDVGDMIDMTGDVGDITTSLIQSSADITEYEVDMTEGVMDHSELPLSAALAELESPVEQFLQIDSIVAGAFQDDWQDLHISDQEENQNISPDISSSIKNKPQLSKPHIPIIQPLQEGESGQEESNDMKTPDQATIPPDSYSEESGTQSAEGVDQEAVTTNEYTPDEIYTKYNDSEKVHTGVEAESTQETHSTTNLPQMEDEDYENTEIISDNTIATLKPDIQILTQAASSDSDKILSISLPTSIGVTSRPASILHPPSSSSITSTTIKIFNLVFHFGYFPISNINFF